jgi:HPt (histidine-containing phosphotransfer) domain-containing protein
MGPMKHRPPTEKRVPAATQDDFGDLRQAFYSRLQSERLHLVTLSAALARTEESPVTIFDNLVFRAHRLRGSAAIFDIAEIAEAASVLERAAGAASTSQASQADAAVWSALVGLVNLMGEVEGANTEGAIAGAA